MSQGPGCGLQFPQTVRGSKAMLVLSNLVLTGCIPKSRVAIAANLDLCRLVLLTRGLSGFFGRCRALDGQESGPWIRKAHKRHTSSSLVDINAGRPLQAHNVGYMPSRELLHLLLSVSTLTKY